MIDFDALVLGPVQAVFGCPAVVTPAVSQPNGAAYLVRGIFALRGQDIQDETGAVVRADDYTFGVRASEFTVLTARGDLVSEIQHPSFQRFLADRIFVIEDTGDDGMGNQSWILKEQRTVDDDP